MIKNIHEHFPKFIENGIKMGFYFDIKIEILA